MLEVYSIILRLRLTTSKKTTTTLKNALGTSTVYSEWLPMLRRHLTKIRTTFKLIMTGLGGYAFARLFSAESLRYISSLYVCMLLHYITLHYITLHYIHENPNLGSEIVALTSKNMILGRVLVWVLAVFKQKKAFSLKTKTSTQTSTRRETIGFP